MDNKIKYMHVAGTNGKGSTCTFIAHGLIKSGYKTGKFTSPHILDITERITVNDIPIPAEKIPDLPKDAWFETLWETALLYFREQNVDYAVIETGIGGLLDCTNKLDLPEYSRQLFEKTARTAAFTPVTSVITKIGYDHMDLLGNTIEEIASHKAGIIKTGVPVVTDPTQLPKAMQVIRETAERKNSPLIVPTVNNEDYMTCNAAVATETLSLLGIEQCDFSEVKLPARMQTVSKKPLIIIDGAHNVDAIRAVLKRVDEYPHNKIIVFGMQKSKDYDSCVKLLANRQVVYVEDVNCLTQVGQAITKAQKSADSDSLIFICGSMYLAGNALNYFNKLP